MIFEDKLIKDLPSIWRIVICTMFFQMVGSIITLFAQYSYNPFLNLWIGGAIATPIGFVFGLSWQLINPARRSEMPVQTTVFIGVIAVVLGGIAVFQEIPDLTKENKLLASLKSIECNSIKQIRITNIDDDKLVKVIESRDAIKEFCMACSDVHGNMLNHPSYISSWYVVIEGKPVFELECNFEKSNKAELIGQFVEKKDNLTRYYGSFASINMRDWFNKNLRLNE